MKINFRTGEFECWWHEIAWLLSILSGALGILFEIVFHDLVLLPFIIGYTLFFLFMGAIMKSCEKPKTDPRDV